MKNFNKLVEEAYTGMTKEYNNDLNEGRKKYGNTDELLYIDDDGIKIKSPYGQYIAEIETSFDSLVEFDFKAKQKIVGEGNYKLRRLVFKFEDELTDAIEDIKSKLEKL